MKKLPWNMIHLLGSGGIGGVLFLFYYYRRKQSNLQYSQNISLLPVSKKSEIEIKEQRARITIVKVIDHEIKDRNLNNLAISPYSKSTAIDNKIENGNLSNAAVHHVRSINNSTRLQDLLQQTDSRKQITLSLTQGIIAETKTKSSASSTQLSSTDERKISVLANSHGHTVIGGNLYTFAVHNNNAPLIVNGESSSPSLSSNSSQIDLPVLLRSYYRRHDQLENVLTGIPLSLKESHYVQLAIVQQDEQKEKEKQAYGGAENQTNFRDERVGSYEKIYGTKNPIELKDFFKPDKDCKDEPKRLLVLGRAGIGKSTLCQYIAWCWSEEKGLWSDRFDAIFWIKLRDLENYQGKDDREEILSWLIHKIWQRDKDKELNEKQIAAWLKVHTGRILFLLDGFDEVVQLNGKQSSTPAGRALYTLLTEEYVIITSRPNYVNTFWSGTQKIIDRCVENIGFSNEQIERYTQHFFSAHNMLGQEKELLIWLKQSPSIWGIAHIPINTSFICSIWYQDIQKNYSARKHIVYSRTMTELYGAMVNALLDRYLEKMFTKQALSRLSKETEEKNKENVIVFLSRLAFVAMQKETRSIIIQAETMNAVFKEIFEEEQGKVLLKKRESIQGKTVRDMEDKLDRDEFFKYIRLAGFLTSLSKDVHLRENRKDYYFLHLTFQEYFTARYLAHGFAQDPKSTRYKEAVTCLKQHKFDPSYEIVWWFTAGLVQELGKDNRKPNAVDAFWQELMNAPRDLIGFKELVLFAHLLTEGENDKFNTIQKQWWKALEQYLSKNNIDEEILRSAPQKIIDQLFLNYLSHIYSNKNDEETTRMLNRIAFRVSEIHAEKALYAALDLLQRKSDDSTVEIINAHFFEILFNKIDKSRQEKIISILFKLLEDDKIHLPIKIRITDYFSIIFKAVNEIQKLQMISFSINLLQNKTFRISLSESMDIVYFLEEHFKKSEKTQQEKIILILFDLLKERDEEVNGIRKKHNIGIMLRRIFKNIDETGKWKIISLLLDLLENAKKDEWARIIESNIVNQKLKMIPPNFLSYLFLEINKIQKEKVFSTALNILQNEKNSNFSKIKAANFLELLFPALNDTQKEKMILVCSHLIQNKKAEDWLEIIRVDFLNIFFLKMGKVQQKKILFDLLDLLQNNTVSSLIKEEVASYLKVFLPKMYQEETLSAPTISLQDEISPLNKEKTTSVVEILFLEMKEIEQEKMMYVSVTLLQDKKVLSFAKKQVTNILKVLFLKMAKAQQEKILSVSTDLLEDKKKTAFTPLDSYKRNEEKTENTPSLSFDSLLDTIREDVKNIGDVQRNIVSLLISFLPIINEAQKENLFSTVLYLLNNGEVNKLSTEQVNNLLASLFPILSKAQQERLILSLIDLLQDMKMNKEKRKWNFLWRTVHFLEILFPKMNNTQQEKVISILLDLLFLNEDFDKWKISELLKKIFPNLDRIQQQQMISISLLFFQDKKMLCWTNAVISFLIILFPKMNSIQQQIVLSVSLELLSDAQASENARRNAVELLIHYSSVLSRVQEKKFISGLLNLLQKIKPNDFWIQGEIHTFLMHLIPNMDEMEKKRLARIAFNIIQQNSISIKIVVVKDHAWPLVKNSITDSYHRYQRNREEDAAIDILKTIFPLPNKALKKFHFLYILLQCGMHFYNEYALVEAFKYMRNSRPMRNREETDNNILFMDISDVAGPMLIIQEGHQQLRVSIMSLHDSHRAFKLLLKIFKVNAKNHRLPTETYDELAKKYDRYLSKKLVKKKPDVLENFFLSTSPSTTGIAPLDFSNLALPTATVPASSVIRSQLRLLNILKSFLPNVKNKQTQPADILERKDNEDKTLPSKNQNNQCRLAFLMGRYSRKGETPLIRFSIFDSQSQIEFKRVLPEKPEREILREIFEYAGLK